MLAQARARAETPDLIQAAAEGMPIESETFDLVYCVNAIHHFAEPSAFIRSARRVLRPGGTMAVIGSDPRHHQANWYVYEYFPATYPRDLSRFPTWDTVAGWLLEAGFTECDLRLVEYIHDPKTGADVLSDPYLEKNATSQLALLSEAEYAHGIERIKKALASSTQANEELVFHSDIYLYMLKAGAPD
jgi:SAM-dependent methyltransferase